MSLRDQERAYGSRAQFLRVPKDNFVPPPCNITGCNFKLADGVKVSTKTIEETLDAVDTMVETQNPRVRQMQPKIKLECIH